MAWEKIIGQNRIKEQLMRAILDNKVAQTYCFWGNEGTGKEAAAIEFAKTLNCLNPIIKGQTIESCGECSSCKQCNSLQHQNIQFIFSLPPSKTAETKGDSVYSRLSDDQLETVYEQLEKKSKDYYYRIALQNANIIKIASIREVKRNLSKTQIREGRRFIIVFRADEMNAEAANSFLKTLEEPNDNTTIILTTSRRELLLPTIISRCQQIHFPPLSIDEICLAITSRFGIKDDVARTAAALGQGSYNKSVEFLNEELQKLKTIVVDALKASLKKRNYRAELMQHLDYILKQKDKLLLEKFLNLLLIWIRDAIIVSVNDSYKSIYNISQIDILKRFATNFSSNKLDFVIELIENAISLIRKNVQNQLILINLFIQLRKYLMN